MKVLLRLWKESFKRVVPVAGAAILVSLILFFAFGCYSLVKTASPVTLAGLAGEDMAGAWVEDDVVHIYAAYARESAYQGGELSGIRGVQYVIPFGDGQYIGMFVHGERVEEAQELLAACDREYLVGGGGDLPVLHVRGTVRAMDGDTLALYRAAAGGDATVEQCMLPYLLDVDRLGGHAPATLLAVLVLCVAMLASGVAAIVWTVTWGGQKKLLARAAEYGELPKMVEKLEKFYESSHPIGNVWLDSYYVLFQSGAVSVLCRPWDIAWVYRRPVRMTFFGSARVTFRMMDGGRYSMWMEERDVRLLMSALGELAPGVERGWSRAMAREYRQDRAGFAHRWEEARAEAKGR